MKRETRISSRWLESVVFAAIYLAPFSFVTTSFAQRTAARFAMDSSLIVDAMRAVLLPTDGVQVQLAAPVTSSLSAARLEVVSVWPLPPHQVRLRLACGDHGACLPFFATMTYPDSVDVSKLALGRRVASTSDHNAKTENLKGVSDVGQSINLPTVKREDILRAGSQAMLQFDADKIHVRMEVICLQSGRPGSRVRVASVDHKQTYTAEVITPLLLKGQLSK